MLCAIWRPHHHPSMHACQSFMVTYQKLKDELLTDSLLGKPPIFAKEWFAEVGSLAAGGRAVTGAPLLRAWTRGRRTWTTTSLAAS